LTKDAEEKNPYLPPQYLTAGYFQKSACFASMSIIETELDEVSENDYTKMSEVSKGLDVQWYSNCSNIIAKMQ